MNTTHQKYSPSEITWADQLADTGPSQGGKWVFFPGAAALEAPKLPQGIFSRLLNIFNFFLGGGGWLRGWVGGTWGRHLPRALTKVMTALCRHVRLIDKSVSPMEDSPSGFRYVRQRI